MGQLPVQHQEPSMWNGPDAVEPRGQRRARRPRGAVQSRHHRLTRHAVLLAAPAVVPPFLERLTNQVRRSRAVVWHQGPVPERVRWVASSVPVMSERPRCSFAVVQAEGPRARRSYLLWEASGEVVERHTGHTAVGLLGAAGYLEHWLEVAWQPSEVPQVWIDRRGPAF